MACFLKRQVGGEKKKMRKQIVALAIFAVLLVAAGAVVSMAQDTYSSNDEPVIFPTAGGVACLDFAAMGNGFEIELTPIGSNTWLIGGEDVCWAFSVSLDGIMVLSDGVFNIGITGYPVAPGTAPAHFSGFIDPADGWQGHVWWTNPTVGTSGEDDWGVTGCPCPCGCSSAGLGSPYE